MTKESKILIAPALPVFSAVAAVALAAPFVYEPAFFPDSPRPELGWTGAAFAIVTLAYSARKRLFLQAPGELIYWKAAHIFTGYVFILAAVLHSNGDIGAGARLALNAISGGLLLTGLWGVVRQGNTPAMMTSSLLDPVYKSEHAEAADMILREISSTGRDKSRDFVEIYQRHILPFISIKHPTLENHKAIVQRLFGPVSTDPNAAVTDLERLSPEENNAFYEIAEKAVDLVELRLSKTYQRGMNQWLLWHIGLTVLFVSALFFHVLAALYFGSHGLAG